MPDPGTTTPIRRVTLALPAYNEAARIGELLEQAATVFVAEQLEWAIVVVDDGSEDETAARVKAKAQTEPGIKLIQHPANRGLGRAIVTGLRAALEFSTAPDHLIVCMDADLTHPPETIPGMRQAAERGADLVIASRFQPGSRQVGVPAFRRFLSWGARTLFRHTLVLPGVKDYTCGFRAFRASLLAAGFDRYGEGLITRRGFACTDELLIHLATLKPVIREVPFILRYDLKAGPSKLRLGTTILETLKLMMAHRRTLKKNR